MSESVIEILLVEDNPGDIRLAQETLKDYRLQNRIHIVRDGEEALQYLRRQPPFETAQKPDMVMLDLSLPKLDGFEVLEALQQDPDLRAIPIVILTSTKTDREALKKHNIPTDCWIMKPLTLERYLEAVRCFPHLGVSIVKLARVPG
jgi:CheY-like chemotaxis protein